MSLIRDAGLSESGKKKIAWVRRHMPILHALELDFIQSKPFEGLRIALSIHLEAKTAYMAQLLAAGGARVFATGCNPLSTQDDVAAALAESGIEVFALYGATDQEYRDCLIRTIENVPHMYIDDGGDLTQLFHTDFAYMLPRVWGGTEETTTGISRLRARERAGQLHLPMIDVNDADCKHLFDNRYGTGQSVLDGIMRSTNLIIAGKNAVVAGYGFCGKGISMRARGMGANVIVTEVDKIKAMEAVMDGFRVMPMDRASRIGNLFITATGCRDVIRKEHMLNMPDEAILCNAGHFDVEISKRDLDALTRTRYTARNNIVTYELTNGKRLNLLADGRLVNLAAADGHPAEIMDMSFALQVLSLKYLSVHHAAMTHKVYSVPAELDREVARLRLASWGVEIDELSDEQRDYLDAWE